MAQPIRFFESCTHSARKSRIEDRAFSRLGKFPQRAASHNFCLVSPGICTSTIPEPSAFHYSIPFCCARAFNSSCSLRMPLSFNSLNSCPAWQIIPIVAMDSKWYSFAKSNAQSINFSCMNISNPLFQNPPNPAVKRDRPKAGDPLPLRCASHQFTQRVPRFLQGVISLGATFFQVLQR